MLKPIALSVACLTMPVIANAQTVQLACQYYLATGISYKSGVWNQQNFSVREPFFLSSVGGLITLESMVRGAEIGHENFPPSCSTDNLMEQVQFCTDVVGKSFIYNHEQHKGAVSRIQGITMEKDFDRPDDMSINLFTCQPM